MTSQFHPGRCGLFTCSRAESPAGAGGKGALLPKQTFLPEVVSSQVCRSLEASLLKVFGDFSSMISPTSKPAKQQGRQSKAIPLLSVPRLSWAPSCCHSAGSSCGQSSRPSIWMGRPCMSSASPPTPCTAQHSSSPWPLLAHSEGSQHFLDLFQLGAFHFHQEHRLCTPCAIPSVLQMWQGWGMLHRWGAPSPASPKMGARTSCLEEEDLKKI